MSPHFVPSKSTTTSFLEVYSWDKYICNIFWCRISWAADLKYVSSSSKFVTFALTIELSDAENICAFDWKRKLSKAGSKLWKIDSWNISRTFVTFSDAEYHSMILSCQKFRMLKFCKEASCRKLISFQHKCQMVVYSLWFDLSIWL